MSKAHEQTTEMPIHEKYEALLDFVKSFGPRAYKAWKPVQVFRSDEQVAIDEVKSELLDQIRDEAEGILSDIGESFES